MFTKYIAHACGGIENISYSNSLEALNLAYENGHRYIEFDINHTTDGEYVLLHDWQKTRDKIFNKKGRASLAEFKADNMINNYQQLTLAEILIWFKKHPDCYIVSDTKDVTPAEFLAFVKKTEPQLIERIIVQIYYFSQYQKAIIYHPKAIIFGAYHNEYSETEIIEFLKYNPCAAISMTQDKAENNFAFLVKKELNLPTITFTINDIETEKKFQNLAIDFFFTDFLK
ncbi:MAG: hypothetical protein HOH73_02885 [Alphaproteobacteria bacterium]|jgi:glycerophosphoryl diester phosphodiesterase|nr:hypothetical protein [Alphaproteobacteria bacterium]